MKEKFEEAIIKHSVHPLDLENRYEMMGIEEAAIACSEICKENYSHWIAYHWDKIETRPKKTGKYFVHRKDGKVHWETWNGSGWAYNGNVITYYMEIKLPNLTTPSKGEEKK